MANEKRLIDANALLKEIDGIHQRHYANSSYQFIHDVFLAMFRKIKNAPTVDAVEVVRCKDCKFAHGIDSTEPMYACTNPEVYGIGSRGAFVCHSMHFCGYGEREDKDA